VIRIKNATGARPYIFDTIWASAQGQIPTLIMATSRSTSGPPSRGYSYLDSAVWLCSAAFSRQPD